MANVRELAENRKTELSKLSDLVKENNIDAIHKIITETQIAHTYQLYLSIQEYVGSAIRDAILLGRIEIVKLFLTEGIDPNTDADCVDEPFKAAPLLFFASKIGDLAIVKLLVQQGAKVPYKVPYGKYDEDCPCSIRAAVESGHLEVLKYLLEQPGVHANGEICYTYRLNRLTFLGAALLQDKQNLAETLIEHGANIPHSIVLAENKFKIEAEYKKDDDFIKLKASYHRMIKYMMDYAIGIDFDSLSFLDDLDVSEFNFMGTSVLGKPITRDMLLSKTIAGTEKAIFTFSDLKQAEEKRSQLLKNRVEILFQKRGQLVDSNGIVNLVPLWRAAEIGDSKTVATRLKAGINPNEIGDKKEISLAKAAENGHIEIVKMLLTHPQIDAKNITDALFVARKNKHSAVVDLLVSAQDINQQDSKGDTQLHHAVRSGDVEEVKVIIKKGADVNLKGSNTYPLHIAAEKSYDRFYYGRPSPKHVEIVKILLDAKAEPNLINHGSTAMDIAASSGSFDAIKLLMPYVQKTMRTEEALDESSYQSYPWYRDLMFDSYNSHHGLEILNLLKSEGATDFNCKNRLGSTLLHCVMEDFSLVDVPKNMRDIASISHESKIDSIEGSIESFTKSIKLLDFLLENGADPNMTNDNRHGSGATPLYVFMEKRNLQNVKDGYKNIIDRFIKKGFKIDAPNYRGETLLHLAASENDCVTLQCLIDAGANINSLDEYNNTPLHFAAAGKPDATKLLIHVGAKISIRNIYGLTPLEFSKEECQKRNRDTFNSSTFRNNSVNLCHQAQAMIAAVELKPSASALQTLGNFSETAISRTSKCNAVDNNLSLLPGIKHEQ